MAVYVDSANIPFRGQLMCHMLADTIDELHGMADAIGMQRRWFQPYSFPHYDLPLHRRAAAVRLGAIEVDRRGIVHVMRRLRANPDFVAALAVERARHAARFG
jgi:hypothetical protein